MCFVGVVNVTGTAGSDTKLALSIIQGMVGTWSRPTLAHKKPYIWEVLLNERISLCRIKSVLSLKMRTIQCSKVIIRRRDLLSRVLHIRRCYIQNGLVLGVRWIKDEHGKCQCCPKPPPLQYVTWRAHTHLMQMRQTAWCVCQWKLHTTFQQRLLKANVFCFQGQTPLTRWWESKRMQLEKLESACVLKQRKSGRLVLMLKELSSFFPLFFFQMSNLPSLLFSYPYCHTPTNDIHFTLWDFQLRQTLNSMLSYSLVFFSAAVFYGLSGILCRAGGYLLPHVCRFHKWQNREDCKNKHVYLSAFSLFFYCKVSWFCYFLVTKQ